MHTVATWMCLCEFHAVKFSKAEKSIDVRENDKDLHEKDDTSGRVSPPDRFIRLCACTRFTQRFEPLQKREHMLNKSYAAFGVFLQIALWIFYLMTKPT